MTACGPHICGGADRKTRSQKGDEYRPGTARLSLKMAAFDTLRLHATRGLPWPTKREPNRTAE